MHCRCFLKTGPHLLSCATEARSSTSYSRCWHYSSGYFSVWRRVECSLKCIHTIAWTMATVQTTQTRRQHVQSRWYSNSVITCYISKVSPMQNMLPYAFYFEAFLLRPICYETHWWFMVGILINKGIVILWFIILYYNDAYIQQYIQYLPTETFNLKSCQNISLLALIMFD